MNHTSQPFPVTAAGSCDATDLASSPRGCLTVLLTENIIVPCLQPGFLCDLTLSVLLCLQKSGDKGRAAQTMLSLCPDARSIPAMQSILQYQVSMQDSFGLRSKLFAARTPLLKQPPQR
jgi:hypothetical protein